MKTLKIWTTICVGCMILASSARSSAQTFTTLAMLTSSQGAAPFSSLVQGRDGNFYGTAYNAGLHGWGSVFRVTPEGALTVLHSFCALENCADGASPGTIVLATDGNFYGLTSFGGALCPTQVPAGCGTVFKISRTGSFTILHSFDGTDGNGPTWLLEGGDRNFYGTAFAGGSGTICANGCGTVFKMTPGGTTTIVHNFNKIDGLGPMGIVQGADEELYGTTYGGGKNDPAFCEPFGGCGTVFKVTTGGTFTRLHSFDLTDGAILYGPVAQASNGVFYGTTFYGGGDGGADGSIFSITPKGHFQTVYQFSGIDMNPTVGLYPATDGNLYGTLEQGGDCNTGLIYSVSQTSVFSTVYGNCQASDYTDAVVQSTNGAFYGTYLNSVYRFNNEIGPFIAFVLPAGKRGQTAQILGQGLTGTSGVTFNGVPAAGFNVVSDTYMTAVVPSGATTGRVLVTTPSGILTSNVNFRVGK